MLKRPSTSSRLKGGQSQIQLNLIPILDTMVTLIAFLLFTMSFLSIVSIESPFPVASPEQVQQKLKERPLQLTVTIRESDTEIWSPFGLIEARKIPNPSAGQPDVQALHQALVEVKQKFPTESQIVIVPQGGITYDTLVASMDSMRMLDATDPPLFVKNPATGNDDAVKSLFPEIVFGNLLGDS